MIDVMCRGPSLEMIGAFFTRQILLYKPVVHEATRPEQWEGCDHRAYGAFPSLSTSSKCRCSLQR